VEFTVQANVQANIAREGAALQHRRLQSQQRRHVQLQSAAAHLLQGAGRQEMPDHRIARLHLRRQGNGQITFPLLYIYIYIIDKLERMTFRCSPDRGKDRLVEMARACR